MKHLKYNFIGTVFLSFGILMISYGTAYVSFSVSTDYSLERWIWSNNYTALNDAQKLEYENQENVSSSFLINGLIGIIVGFVLIMFSVKFLVRGFKDKGKILEEKDRKDQKKEVQEVVDRIKDEALKDFQMKEFLKEKVNVDIMKSDREIKKMLEEEEEKSKKDI